MAGRSPFYKSPWFFLIIIGIILILIGVIIRLATKKSTTGFWVILLGGVFFFILGIILFIVWTIQPSKQKKLEQEAQKNQLAHVGASFVQKFNDFTGDTD